MAKLEWTEVKGRFIAVPVEGVIVTASKTGLVAEWSILVNGERVKHGVCGNLEDAKTIAFLESERLHD
jgi:hypothetical protein